MLPQLTLDNLVHSAYDFCEQQNGLNHVELLGVTDGKAIGNYVEHRFQAYLQEHYTVKIGNSAMGIDLPGSDIMTDIKVTSVNHPQSSCPFKSARQKVFGLGYNLPKPSGQCPVRKGGDTAASFLFFEDLHK